MNIRQQTYYQGHVLGNLFLSLGQSSLETLGVYLVTLRDYQGCWILSTELEKLWNVWMGEGMSC